MISPRFLLGNVSALCLSLFSIIDQQIALHFVHYSECLSNPLTFYATKIINSLLLKGYPPIKIKGWDLSQS